MKLTVSVATIASLCTATPRGLTAQPSGGASRSWTIGDSLRYVRDSVTIDSVSRLVPVDSIRRLYRDFVNSSDPRSALFGLQCESYRLRYAFGYAGEIADDRVRVEEWKPELFSRIRAALDAAISPLTMPRLPTRVGCGVPDNAPFAPDRLRYPPLPPWRPTYVQSGSSLDVIERGETLFEGKMTARLVGRDTEIAVAGSASLSLRNERSLELRLDDKLNGKEIIGFYFRLSPGPFFYRGTYPILDEEDARSVPYAIGAYMQSGTVGGIVSGRWKGTLVVERADSTQIEGHASFVMVGQSLDRRDRFGSHIPLIGSALDTVRFEGWFRAKYNPREEREGRAFTMFPELPRRFAPPAPPDARKTLARVFLDDSIPCERLPIYEPDTTRMPQSIASQRSVRAAVEMVLDSTGTPWPGTVHITALADKVEFQDLIRPSWLRFRRTAPDQVLRKVRCTVNLPLR